MKPQDDGSYFEWKMIVSQGRWFRVKLVRLASGFWKAVQWLCVGVKPSSDPTAVISSVVRMLASQGLKVSQCFRLSTRWIKQGGTLRNIVRGHNMISVLFHWYGSLRKMNSGYARRTIELFPLHLETYSLTHTYTHTQSKALNPLFTFSKKDYNYVYSHLLDRVSIIISRVFYTLIGSYYTAFTFSMGVWLIMVWAVGAACILGKLTKKERRKHQSHCLRQKPSASLNSVSFAQQA